MRKLFILTLFCLAIGISSGQTGNRLNLGTVFKSTDSTIVTNEADSTVGSGEVIYSGLIPVMNYDGGVFSVSVYHDSIETGAATYEVAYRQFYRARPAGKKWGDWKVINAAGTQNDNTLQFQRSATVLTTYTSSQGVQIRVTQSAAAGKSEHYIGIYN